MKTRNKYQLKLQAVRRLSGIKREREVLERAGVDFSKPKKEYRLIYSIWRGTHEVPESVERQEEFEAHGDIHAKIIAQRMIENKRHELSPSGKRVQSCSLVEIVVREKTVSIAF